jgi:hypothetical protein
MTRKVSLASPTASTSTPIDCVTQRRPRSIQLHGSTDTGSGGEKSNGNGNDDANKSNDDSDTSSDFDQDCPDEEECEIDWSLMPTTTDEYTDMNVQDDDEHVEEQDEYNDFKEVDYAPATVTEDFSRMRLRLEMQWQMTAAAKECNVDQPDTCDSDPCEDCEGRGWKQCRFCKGTTVLWMQQPQGGESTFSNCRICDKGAENCRSCKGSGWISNWTKLQENKL